MNRLVTMLGVLFLCPCAASAQEALEVSWHATGSAYERVVVWRNAAAVAIEAYADVRALRLEVRSEGDRRARRCRAPGAPSRPISEVRWVPLAPGETHEELVDVRWLCMASARSALERGGHVVSRYGFAARGRRAGPSIAQTTAGEPLGPSVVSLEEIDLPARAPAARPADGVTVTMADAAAFGSARVVRVGVRSYGRRPRRIVVRSDLFRFLVHGPQGDVACSLGRLAASPLAPRYRRTGRRGQHDALTLREYCPRETFDAQGMYEITPVFDGVYDGGEVQVRAWTGSVLGRPAWMRVLRARRGYVVVPPRGQPPSGRSG